MSGIFVHGIGAVSPAGWGVPALRAVLETGLPQPIENLSRPGWEKPASARRIPPPATRPAFLAHPRLRRASPMTHFAVAAALEALGNQTAGLTSAVSDLGIIVCMTAGSVGYTRRFYQEVLHDPATASPLIFPETVFNAPASHVAAYLETPAINYTLVGDAGAFLQGLALGANWLADGKVNCCLVIATEETDWIIADALQLFRRRAIHGAGAGALLLARESGHGAIAELAAITDSFSYTQDQNRARATTKMRSQLPACAANELLCASAEPTEAAAWRDWDGPRLAAKAILGEGLTATVAWQCVAACDMIRQNRYSAANVSVVGLSQQAIGARFVRPEFPPVK